MNQVLSPQILQRHIPALTGLRAIAVFWVILHNGAFDPSVNLDSIFSKVLALLINTGWLGVQLFFVLSGFLITDILLTAKGKAHFYKHFYARRALRIFPVYFLFLLATFILVKVLADPAEWMVLADNQKWWFIFYLNNWIQVSQNVGLSHFWSLAIEEQFYLFWPLLIMLVDIKRLYLACYLIIIISVLFRFIMTYSGLEFSQLGAYILTPSRMDALAIGALLAISIRYQGLNNQLERIASIATVLGLGYVIIILTTTHNFAKASEGWAFLNQTVAAILFACLIFNCLNITPQTNKKLHIRLLSIPIMQSLGKYSYAMYIFHLPISLFLHSHITRPLTAQHNFSGGYADFLILFLDLSALLLLTYLCAWASWHLVERRALSLKRYFPTPSGKQ